MVHLELLYFLVTKFGICAFMSSCSKLCCDSMSVHSTSLACQSCYFPCNFDVVGVVDECGCWVSLLDASVATMGWHLWAIVFARLLCMKVDVC